MARVDLSTLIYFILRRLAVLQSEREEWDTRPILQEAEKTVLLQEALFKVATEKGRDNVYRTGTLVYDRIPDTLLPLCLAGSILHVGKGTRYGNGTYHFLPTSLPSDTDST
jgi:hypothetical protein